MFGIFSKFSFKKDAEKQTLIISPTIIKFVTTNKGVTYKLPEPIELKEPMNSMDAFVEVFNMVADKFLEKVEE